MRQSLGFLATLITVVVMLVPTSLADEQIGVFRIFDSHPNVVVLDGEIGINTPLEFRRALAARPEATVVVLNSPGGLVASGLILANDIHDRGLATTIPEGAGCYSACAFVFFAGAERLVEGELGVHQMYGTNDTSGVQARVSDIIEALEQFGTPTAVVTRMFRTPSDDMYVFSLGEIDSLAINVLGPSVMADLSGLGLVSPAFGTENAPMTATSAPTEAEPNGGLRLALYGGLDFYGSDVSSQRTKDAVECASMCLYDDRCLAFTFNANPSVTRGPNCFLKGGIERLEAYADAMSGIFLFPEDGDAITYSIGAIDPTQDVLPRQGLSGRDFNTSPERGISSPGACRMACVDDNACRAFTYDSRLKQCYLKHNVGTAFASTNLTSGIKRGATFPPIDVIDLSE
ncbi:PAN domain-containing protein [Devosia salina]|uniref:Apple domain-containing protein n=1 Tax=Devosia salina TaxID=2860336 RepID=A0ABX8WDB8_9HYPH|nr:PAN domain-containing protein [Devosia salina]QYO76930.1 hypothetical protein K1X15_20605 [Devosia salina]